jgi:hypothetical protein
MPLGGVDRPLEKDYKNKSKGLLGFKSHPEKKVPNFLK